MTTWGAQDSASVARGAGAVDAVDAVAVERCFAPLEVVRRFRTSAAVSSTCWTRNRSRSRARRAAFRRG